MFSLALPKLYASMNLSFLPVAFQRSFLDPTPVSSQQKILQSILCPFACVWPYYILLKECSQRKCLATGKRNQENQSVELLRLELMKFWKMLSFNPWKKGVLKKHSLGNYWNNKGQAGGGVFVFVIPALPGKCFCTLPTKFPASPWTQGVVSTLLREATVPRGYPQMSLSKTPKSPQGAFAKVLLCLQIVLYYWADKEVEQRQDNYVT